MKPSTLVTFMAVATSSTMAQPTQPAASASSLPPPGAVSPNMVSSSTAGLPLGPSTGIGSAGNSQGHGSFMPSSAMTPTRNPYMTPSTLPNHNSTLPSSSSSAMLSSDDDDQDYKPNASSVTTTPDTTSKSGDPTVKKNAASTLSIALSLTLTAAVGLFSLF